MEKIMIGFIFGLEFGLHLQAQYLQTWTRNYDIVWPFMFSTIINPSMIKPENVK